MSVFPVTSRDWMPEERLLSAFRAIFFFTWTLQGFQVAFLGRMDQTQINSNCKIYTQTQ